MQARYYDPVIGRFYSNDPVGYSPNNPVGSFNRYSYVNNNPYKYTDPTGMCFWDLCVLEVTLATKAVVVVGTAVAVTVSAYYGSKIYNKVKEDGEGATQEELDNSSNPDDPSSGKPLTQKEREEFWEDYEENNDGYECWRCGYKSEDKDEFEIGHKNVPRSKNGTKHKDNLDCEGQTCNRSAGNRGKAQTSCLDKKGSSCG